MVQYKDGEAPVTATDADRFDQTEKIDSHKINDTKDQMSVQDKAALEKKLEKEEAEAKENKPRPTEIAKSHGNKPSRGAIIDEEIENEERAELERKGKI